MEVKEKTQNKEVLKFGAETGKILHLMIHSLYTNKDIFLRELISNASDACDKLKFLSITNPSLIDDDSSFHIQIKVNEEEKTITISDNGIGMNRQELIDNIGTIASSGTQKFMNQISGNAQKDLQLIGQFGVGFYSSFMVATKVEVTSKKAGENETWFWSSDGEGSFEISEIEDSEISRGTSIKLYLREDLNEYLDKYRLKHVISTYSDHIQVPIEWINEKLEVEVLNSASALWKRPKSEITNDQYKEFYKSIAHQPDEPWMILHNKNEGAVEFTNLLFVPSSKPFDLFHPDRKSRVKLYVKRVFIADEGIDLIPSYLRFLRGIVDSEDIPLNISRETLQHNNMISKIRKAITKKLFSEFKKKINDERDSYETFWNNFGSVVKEGLCESFDDKDQILDCCLFKSALSDKMITLDEYIANMKPNQKNIYFLSGDQADKIKNSPQLEGFLKRKIDVLLFIDTVDDFWVNVCNQYKEKELKSVTRSGIDLEELDPDSEKKENKNSQAENQENKDLIEFFKNTLSTNVSDVKISGKLVESPILLSVAEGAMDIRMERYLKDQKQLTSSSAKIIEININHPIIKKISSFLKSSKKDDAEELVRILFDQACIIEGEPVLDTSLFSKRMNSFLEKALI